MLVQSMPGALAKSALRARSTRAARWSARGSVGTQLYCEGPPQGNADTDRVGLATGKVCATRPPDDAVLRS
jgi:hypothetical protein